MPQHQLPTFRQRGEGACGECPVVVRVRLTQYREIEDLRYLLACIEPAIFAHPVVIRIADRCHQVGTERQLWTAAIADRLEHPREALGDDVVGVGPRAGEAARCSIGRFEMTAVQLGKRSVVAVAHRCDQFGVARRLRYGKKICHGVVAAQDCRGPQV